MENATKALLIAAAVLVAILIISLGLAVYNMAAETMGNVNLSGQEVQAFNDQFITYQGNAKRGSEVNALLKTIVTNNITKTQEGKTQMVVITTGNALTTNIAGTETAIPTVDTSRLYNVTVNLDGNGGLVHTIDISQR